MHLIRCATVSVEDVERSEALYGSWLGYETAERGEVPDTLARSWGTPECAGAAQVVMRPASGAECFLRFVEQPAVEAYQPLRSFGWAAVELTVRDTDALHTKLKESPFEVVGPPKELDGMSHIYPMQVRGPDGEIVYLTEIREQPEGYRLLQASSDVDQVFILVLACRDAEATGRWLEGVLGLEMGGVFEITYSMINTAFGLPADTKHPLATLRYGDDVFLEVDSYPEAAVERPRHEGWLPPGVAMGTFMCPRFAEVEGWVAEPDVHDGSVYRGRRSGVVRGPDGAMLELVEG